MYAETKSSKTHCAGKIVFVTALCGKLSNAIAQHKASEACKAFGQQGTGCQGLVVGAPQLAANATKQSGHVCSGVTVSSSCNINNKASKVAGTRLAVVLLV